MTNGQPEVKKRYYTRLMDIYRHSDIFIPGFNSVARSVLQKKAESDFKVISQKSINQSEEIQIWFDMRHLFFGHGVFRSGTTFLADFLNRNTSNSIVQHEANINDYWYYAKALKNADAAQEYIEEYRIAEIFYRLRPFETCAYGEINPFLRRHCEAIAKTLPAAKQFHLVRDPKEVLRSLMSRELFDRKDPMAAVIQPPTQDPYHEKWPAMSRFEKLCWIWAADNRFVRQHVSHCVKFEGLLSSQDYFEEKILSFLNLEMKREVWNKEIGRVNNSTPRYTFPTYGDWSRSEKHQFEVICGSELQHYGY